MQWADASERKTDVAENVRYLLVRTHTELLPPTEVVDVSSTPSCGGGDA